MHWKRSENGGNLKLLQDIAFVRTNYLSLIGITVSTVDAGVDAIFTGKR